VTGTALAARVVAPEADQPRAGSDGRRELVMASANEVDR
jgi:hypothetical protein